VRTNFQRTKACGQKETKKLFHHRHEKFRRGIFSLWLNIGFCHVVVYALKPRVSTLFVEAFLSMRSCGELRAPADSITSLLAYTYDCPS
jgi:hypothetical protein